MIEKIPMVTPSKESIVRRRFDLSAFHAKAKLSTINLSASIMNFIM